MEISQRNFANVGFEPFVGVAADAGPGGVIVFASSGRGGLDYGRRDRGTRSFSMATLR